MDWGVKLRRTQSMKSLPARCDKPAWANMGLRDKATSVSELVARYQTTVKVSTIVQETSVSHEEGSPVQVLQESPIERKDTHLNTKLRRNEEREESRAATTALRHAKSMDSLQSGATSIVALRAKYEATVAAENKENSSFRDASFTSPRKAAVAVMNGEAARPKSAAKEQTPVKAARNAGVQNGVEATKDHASKKASILKKVERRKTVAGVDFEKVAAIEADEKRKSIADFRESSFLQEKLPVSVKAMSALYQSKVAPQSPVKSPQKTEQALSSEPVKRGKLVKMAEDSTPHQRKDGLPPSAPGAEGLSGGLAPHPVPSQFSKEKLHQQRQKCELRRLLKHTHPELKMLDDVVDEELAEVLSSETETAGETGYEGEVFSRRLIFETSGFGDTVSPSTKIHVGKATVERGDTKKMSAVCEQPNERPPSGCVKGLTDDDSPPGFRPDLNSECEEEMVRIDVKAAKKLFESQPENTFKPNAESNFQAKVNMFGSEAEAVQKQKKQFDLSSKESLQQRGKCSDLEQPERESRVQAAGRNVESHPSKETVFEDDFTSRPDSDGYAEAIKTSAALFQNNPFVSTNIEREYSSLHARDGGTGEDCLTANVKNRAHLFESMPFDKIKHQNQDDVEAMVENIKETLRFLYNANVIHSFGSIIEVNETMIAKKAKFTLSEVGPVINYDDVAEGGAQNFVLHSLPRANLKPRITYLKEDRRGCMQATIVDVPVHQRQFNTPKDSECKTANVAQIVEDILHQDNSLRKGVIIQEEVNNSAKVIVYSLYNYFDKEDVKSYCPAQGAEYNEPEPENTDRVATYDKETRKGIIESAKSSLLETLEDQTGPGSVRCEVAAKGNVKLFRSCIEKGDFDYLKTLQPEAAGQEEETDGGRDTEQHQEEGVDPAEESASEWLPVDIKRLKSIFSGASGPVQPKAHIYDHLIVPAQISNASTGQNVSIGTKQLTNEGSLGSLPSAGAVRVQEQVCGSKVTPQAARSHLEQLEEDGVHQAELVQVVNDDEMSDLQTAIHDLQQATMRAKALQQSREKVQILAAESPEVHGVTCEDQKVDSRTEPRVEVASIPQKHKAKWCSKSVDTSQEVQATEKFSKNHHKSTEVVQDQLYVSPDGSENAPTQEEEEEEVVFHGKFQAALDSLGRSNLNVTKGDFRAAMIYRNSSKPQQEKSQNVDQASRQKPAEGTALTPGPLSHEVVAVIAETPHETKALNQPTAVKASQKKKKTLGPKPVIPPKPEHLTVKQQTNNRDLKGNQNNITRPKEMSPEAPQSSVSCLAEVQQIKSNSDSMDHKGAEPSAKVVQMNQKAEVQCSAVNSESTKSDTNISTEPQVINATADEKVHRGSAAEDALNETEEKHIDFHEARQKFGGKKAPSKKVAPAKPKRVKIAQPAPSDEGNVTQEREVKQESRVEMREKKGRAETEDERRQRLSVHMDEIMRGNTSAAMEIFDNLRKQEELQSLLSRVEEMEQDTSAVDVQSLKNVFENVPDWVVVSDKKKHRKKKESNKNNKLPVLKENAQTKPSMAHVFGDLERASEEIMCLKEQTLARLVDIEEAIKKALYSVSTLKSETDIAGLSCLFKESLGAVQGSPSSGNISKISIESSRTKPQQGNGRAAAVQVKTGSPKQQASPPSSPAFISIQSAARKTEKTEVASSEARVCHTCQQSPKVEEKFRTTKTLTCNSPAQSRKRNHRRGGQKQAACGPPAREVSVLEVHTDPEGKSIVGTKTVKENYERTDSFGNRFYSSKTSTVVTTQPETATAPASQAVVSPASYQVTTYPEVQLPVNQRPK